VPARTTTRPYGLSHGLTNIGRKISCGFFSDINLILFVSAPTIFSYPESKDLIKHEPYFGEEIEFNYSKNSFKFRREILDIEISNADASLLAILQTRANQLLKSVKEKEDVIDRVRVLIASNTGHRTVNTESIALQQNTSVRNLRRILQEKGTSYHNIRDQTLLDIGNQHQCYRDCPAARLL